MNNLSISNNRHYIMEGNNPFFWLGDTAWLLFSNLTKEEAYIYLKNRADKGFNVIQAVLIYSTKDLDTINKMYCKRTDISSVQYWEHIDNILDIAESLGLYVALLPCWGSLIKSNIITEENVTKYTEFLTKRFKNRHNIIWVLGGDIKADNYINLYDKWGFHLKNAMPEKLITFHPFGRCLSAQWFNNRDWLDFHMFQSGHRRYDQCNLGTWDDTNNPSFYGEDNWKYVKQSFEIDNKPVLDGEPSYEWILQGLHDINEPYWKAKDVRRYAYWSVLSGACGHTYGDNSIMQFYKNGYNGVNYGVVCEWEEALHHEGSSQMTHLKNIMSSIDFTNGKCNDNLLIDGQQSRHNRISVFAGNDYLIAYDYSGNTFRLNVSEYAGKDMWWISPVTGIKSYIGKCGSICTSTFTAHQFTKIENGNTDRILYIK